MNRRAVAEQQGRRAETIAAWWLRLHGWRILAQRARVPGGEVDLVARRGKTLAFVEVKNRHDQRSADLALDRHRLKRVAVAAERLTPRYGRGCAIIRVDAIYIVPGRWPRHIPDVWSG